MATGRINTESIMMNYELIGPKAAPVVCLNHCFGSNLHYWDFHLSAFADFQILRFDARGHGQTDAPPGPYSLNIMAADVVGLLDELNLEKVHFCGVSMGGMIAQTLALEYPSRCASLILLNTTCEYDCGQKRLWYERAQSVVRNGIMAVHPILMDRWFTKDAALKQIPGYVYMGEAFKKFKPDSFASVIHAMIELNTTSRLSEIKIPVLVVATPDDPGASTKISKTMARLITTAELQWLQPARHLASLEHPERFNLIARNFLLNVSIV